jgi:hypothetical protein
VVPAPIQSVIIGREMQALDAEPPHRRYYLACVGRWRGAFVIESVDWRAFWAAPLRWWDRWSALSFFLWPARILGALRLETRVALTDAPNLVQHELRVSQWGVTLFASRETLALAENGADVALAGEQRMLPALWRARDLGEAQAQVDANATGASYRLVWLGVPMQQTTRLDDDGLDLVQRTAFSTVRVRLRRL